MLKYKKLFHIPVRFTREVIKYGDKIIIGVSAKAVKFDSKAKPYT